MFMVSKKIKKFFFNFEYYLHTRRLGGRGCKTAKWLIISEKVAAITMRPITFCVGLFLVFLFGGGASFNFDCSEQESKFYMEKKLNR